jgi:hypothetical protein
VTDNLPFTLPDADPTRPERAPRKCVHRWVVMPDQTVCIRCNKERDPSRSKRGRNSRSRGTRDELTVARILGGEKVGELGLPWDVILPGYMRVQCKRLDRWPSLAKVIEWLDAIPAGHELRAVTLADTPGSGGGRTRRLIVLDLDEFARWHGKADR